MTMKEDLDLRLVLSQTFRYVYWITGYIVPTEIYLIDCVSLFQCF